MVVVYWAFWFYSSRKPNKANDFCLNITCYLAKFTLRKPNWDEVPLVF